MIMAAEKLGVSHPPGYPLYLLLTNLFTYLPIGTVAYRANLCAVVCGSAAAGVVGATTVLHTKSVWAGTYCKL